MRRNEIERLIDAANPVNRDAVAGLPIEEAKRALYEAIVAEPRAERRRDDPASSESAPALSRRSRLPRLALGALAASALLVAFVSGLFDGSSGSGTAQAAAGERLTRISPHLLLAAPGWQMQMAEQTGAAEGKIEFAADDLEQHGFLGGRLQIQTQSVARLTWRLQQPDQQHRNRAHREAAIATAEVPGAKALIYELKETGFVPGLGPRREGQLGLPNDRQFSAVWFNGGLHLRLDSSAPNAEAFLRLLESLRRVQGSIWLRALPRPMKLIGGRPIAGIPLAESRVAFHCRPLPAGLAAREDPVLVANFTRECDQ
jgi:hypothetical protein